MLWKKRWRKKSKRRNKTKEGRYRNGYSIIVSTQLWCYFHFQWCSTLIYFVFLCLNIYVVLSHRRSIDNRQHHPSKTTWTKTPPTTTNININQEKAVPIPISMDRWIKEQYTWHWCIVCVSIVVVSITTHHSAHHLPYIVFIKIQNTKRIRKKEQIFPLLFRFPFYFYFFSTYFFPFFFVSLL